MVTLSPLQRQYLALLEFRGLSHSDCCRLIKHFGSLAELCAAEPGSHDRSTNAENLRQTVMACIEGCHLKGSARIDRVVEWLGAAEKRHLLCFEDSEYPPLLRELDCPPLLLFMEGDLEALEAPSLAIVGSRRASQHGEQTGFWLAAGLARHGFCVTSGLARGIDRHAHLGALSVAGRTAAVLGTGIDIIYPRGNKQLARQVTENGLLVSEFPLGTPPRPGNFPQRNRLIAGLSSGVVVVEAAIKSGSLITARLAIENNREVFAVPGSIHSANKQGCHHLIREGAKLVENVDAILEELAAPLLSHPSTHGQQDSLQDRQSLENSGTAKLSTQTQSEYPPPRKQPNSQAPQLQLSAEEDQLLHRMGLDALPADLLASRSGMKIEQVNRLLVGLELKGYLLYSGGRYQRMLTDLQP